ncbi:MAG: GH92 family glycosyl hydrolase [Bacteroidales bacterium]|nr:GH92 family glycosyl hydrolase [Bacteroidales bacterium]
MQRLILFACSALIYGSCSKGVGDDRMITDPVEYVNTFIGTGGHGHTFPGATLPHGMVQLSPDTRTLGWDACGGYHYSDSSIIGFSHTHLSGTGISDLGDVLFMPFTGQPKLDPGDVSDPSLGYRSRFKHESEIAEPGYYCVDLLDYGIKAELTATTRTGFHRYTYPAADQSGIIIDLSHNIYPDSRPEHEFKIISNTEIQGLKRSSGWAKDQYVYFYAKFDHPFSCELYENDKLLSDSSLVGGKKVKAVLRFNNNDGGTVLVKVGISAVDYDGARNNLTLENTGWDFNSIRESAKAVWNDELSKIQVSGGTDDEKTIFYSSLYHTAISPYTFSDVDGRYRGMDKHIYQSDKVVYTVFSLWDTFRALHPLKAIISPQQNADFINTLLTKYDEGGTLPMWELVGNYTGCMIGYHAVPVIVDAYLKGIRGFDVDKAYKAIVEASEYRTDGILFPSEAVKKKLMPQGKQYNAELGYIPCDLEDEAVSKALEYAYNDWCIAQMAKELGKSDDCQKYMERSKRYVKYYDSQTGFMRGKCKDGNWREPFDPRFVRHRKDDYTEGNAFQWSWFVPHDVEGLINLVGGKEMFIAKLDTLFTTDSNLVGDDVSSDITGMIGQYAHGNEPSHHISHMYNFVGQPWKTQELTDKIMKELYFNDPNGLSGNEDCGQMSAWYVLNAMGFYSLCPGDPYYSIGRPIFNKVEINLENGKKFTVIVHGNTPVNKYVGLIKLNGEKLEKPFFTHSDVLNGSTLELTMQAMPNKTN